MSDDSPQIAEPRCPACQVVGVDKIVSTPSKERSKTKQPWFYIVQCSNCGHVYDIISKHSFTTTVTPNFVLPKPS